VQSLPALATWNSSLFMVWSGYQDYFFSLYDKKLTVSQTKKIVPEVVDAIEELIVVSSCLFGFFAIFPIMYCNLRGSVDFHLHPS
jgi:hypothetical protein